MKISKMNNKLKLIVEKENNLNEENEEKFSDMCETIKINKEKNILTTKDTLDENEKKESLNLLNNFPFRNSNKFKMGKTSSKKIIYYLIEFFCF